MYGFKICVDERKHSRRARQCQMRSHSRDAPHFAYLRRKTYSLVQSPVGLLLLLHLTISVRYCHREQKVSMSHDHEASVWPACWGGSRGSGGVRYGLDHPTKLDPFLHPPHHPHHGAASLTSLSATALGKKIPFLVATQNKTNRIHR